MMLILQSLMWYRNCSDCNDDGGDDDDDDEDGGSDDDACDAFGRWMYLYCVCPGYRR